MRSRSRFERFQKFVANFRRHSARSATDTNRSLKIDHKIITPRPKRADWQTALRCQVPGLLLWLPNSPPPKISQAACRFLPTQGRLCVDVCLLVTEISFGDNLADGGIVSSQVCRESGCCSALSCGLFARRKFVQQLFFAAQIKHFLLLFFACGRNTAPLANGRVCSVAFSSNPFRCTLAQFVSHLFVVSLFSLLPAPQQVYQAPAQTENARRPARAAPKAIPPYGKRSGWIPRASEDFGDGGAFPEIHVAQFPLDMGRKGRAGSMGKEIVPLMADGAGNMRFDAIVQQGHPSGTLVHSRPQDAMGRGFSQDQLARPSEEQISETADRTRKALAAKLDNKIKAGTPTHVASAGQTSFIRYTPANSSASHNSGATQRIIRMVEAPADPLEPSKFKNVKAPPPPPSPPAPVMHSPTRQASKQERDEWKIPPCISNWQNNKGFAIPLDKRLAADGRGLQETQISSSFGKLSEVLYIAERNAREQVAKRNSVQKKLALQERDQKEQELREIAQQSRLERAGIVAEMQQETGEERESRMQRDAIREQQRLKREDTYRLERRGSKARAEAAAVEAQERDITEKIALGLSVPKSTEVQYDSRLFNQTQGMDSGFGAEDDYNIFDKPLFGGEREAALYRAPSKDSEMYGDSTSVEKILATNRFKPDRDFSGVDRTQSTGPRSGPVEFEREADPFGLDQFLSDAKSGRKRERSPERGPRLGVMHAAGGGSGKADEYARDPKRQKLNFVAGDQVRSLDPDRDGHRDSDSSRSSRRDDYDRDQRRDSHERDRRR